ISNPYLSDIINGRREALKVRKNIIEILALDIELEKGE
ncbi:XRE family transcriptional regulator, partial [Listeria monocytogenes]|nr:XRE family transcriptional regulator [Listeria monocytogenes]EKN7603503.1 XRE family transcriptional regulator [Listeria monocytogenes]